MGAPANAGTKSYRPDAPLSTAISAATARVLLVWARVPAGSRSRLLAQGCTAEGYGTFSVIMCSPIEISAIWSVKSVSAGPVMPPQSGH
jgi:hypothetical protein